jgi:hypothetical protein
MTLRWLSAREYVQSKRADSRAGRTGESPTRYVPKVTLPRGSRGENPGARMRPACGCLAALLALWLVSLVLAAVLGAGSWVIRQLWPPNPERAKAEQIAFRRVDERDCHDPANVLPLKECLGGPTLLFIAHSRRIGTHEWPYRSISNSTRTSRISVCMYLTRHCLTH